MRDISGRADIGRGGQGAAVSLMFHAGQRPDRARLLAAAQRPGLPFSVNASARPHAADRSAIPGEGGSGAADSGQDPSGSPEGAELIASGLIYDLVGLAPGAAWECGPVDQRIGFDEAVDPADGECLGLVPGPHIAAGARLLPVLRVQAGLAAALAGLEGCSGVCWHPARSLVEPRQFAGSVQRWLEGGVFPGLALASLAMAPDGAMQSIGLALFSGQELRIEPELTADRARAARLALRLMDRLWSADPVRAGQEFAGPEGESLRLEPSANGRFVRVWRG